jgi:hypothetical protein
VKEKKVAIVGAEPLTRDDAPFDNHEYEIWAISNWANADWMKRCDQVIEIHKPEVYKDHPNDPSYWGWLQNTDIPVVMQSPDPDIKNSCYYPLGEIREMLSGFWVKGKPAQALNSSIAYAIALAVLQNYSVIDVYGVEMSNSSEYRSQQPIFAFWIGFAAGKGIKLNVNCTQDLFVQPLYGYEDMMNNEKLHSYINGLKEQQDELKRQENMVEGALTLARQLLDG